MIADRPGMVAVWLQTGLEWWQYGCRQAWNGSSMVRDRQTGLASGLSPGNTEKAPRSHYKSIQDINRYTGELFNTLNISLLLTSCIISVVDNICEANPSFTSRPAKPADL